MSDVKDVGVVIVNYNAGQALLACVESLRSEGVQQIVVVDNGSSDGSDSALAKQEPTIEMLHLNNPGLSAAANVGVQRLTTSIVLFLNPDTRVHPGAIDKLINALDGDESVAIVGPRLLNEDGTLYPSARDFPDFRDSVGHALFGMIAPNNPWTRRYKRLDHDYETQAEVDWVSGAAMFAKRSAWDEVGGLDAGFFLFMEDVDLCWRLRKANWRIVYEPTAEFTHIGGLSRASLPYKTLKMHHQSAIRYNFKTVTGPQRILLPFVAAGLMMRLPVAWVQRWWLARSGR